EFKLTHAQYIARMITPERITSGRRAKTQNAAMLRRVDAEYGVPPHVIAAFWGLESRYGEFKGSHKISDAYLSLIYDGRRGTFFGNQLMALMKIADKNNLEIDDMRGSWAGAMGHFQFIPTTLQQYGVDGDGDGRIDIVNNFADASHSAGNYLSKLGWNKNERILRTVRVPTNFNLSWCDSRTKKTLNEWVAMGITNPDGSAIPRGTREAGMVCDEDSITTTRTAYMVYDNFYRIKKWNNSNAYAVAIALLSDQLR
ncbi:MAG: lytic murein transglycosylase, partial [Alphaproteobacteria bacterium]|nr:lytic murein transglycosylase [Alphaproteobacteria bacterium]